MKRNNSKVALIAMIALLGACSTNPGAKEPTKEEAIKTAFAAAEKQHEATIGKYAGKWEGSSKVDGANTMRRIYIETLTKTAADPANPTPKAIASILVTWNDKMKVATAEYEHSALELVKPTDANGVTVKVGTTATKITIPKDGPTEQKPEALYAADTTTAKDALLISEIKEKSILHIFSGKLDQAGTTATKFTIPEKEVKATAETIKKLDTFKALAAYATDFKWIGK